MSPERSPGTNSSGVESPRMPSAGRETAQPQPDPRTRELGSTKQSTSDIARQTTPGKMAPSGNDEGRKGPSAPPTAQADAQNGRFAAMKEELLKVLPGDRGQNTITVKQDGNRLTVALASNWLFTSGDAALTPEGLDMLKRIGTVLGQVTDRFVQVAGHTDNQAISKALQKTFPDNKALSWARAENARRALINGGMAADRTKAVGMADSRPLASNATEQGRQRNRRLELVIVQGPAVAAGGETRRDDARLAALAPPARCDPSHTQRRIAPIAGTHYLQPTGTLIGHQPCALTRNRRHNLIMAEPQLFSVGFPDEHILYMLMVGSPKI